MIHSHNFYININTHTHTHTHAEMEFLQAISVAMGALALWTAWKILLPCRISPMRAYKKLCRSGFRGPSPSFPLGNIGDMMVMVKTKNMATCSSSDGGYGEYSSTVTTNICNEIHSRVFPYFAVWQKCHGKVFVYWLGTEPFLYVAEPGFLRQMSNGVMGKTWGKPTVFKGDRDPMFGKGLMMVEGDEWVGHRRSITPAFSPQNLKVMTGVMVDSTAEMLNRWSTQMSSMGTQEIDVEPEIMRTAGEIIGKVIFGCTNDPNKGRRIIQMMRALQHTLFRSTRYVGVPFNQFLNLKQTMEAKRLGREIDSLVLSIISSRQKRESCGGGHVPPRDLLGILVAKSNKDGSEQLTTREILDQCKTFFFAGHETTALTLSWTLLQLALHPQWQCQLREEIRDVVGDGELEPTILNRLRKMDWVMNEVLRLYPSAPNVQRQAREDIQVGKRVIPTGTNIWVDLVAMNHDPELWGDDVNEFRPERFKDNLHGGCKDKMGFLPFGFGGRMCVGKNLTVMEYKVVLALILTRFSFSLSPTYTHSPCYMLSIRPAHGIPLILQPLTS